MVQASSESSASTFIDVEREQWEENNQNQLMALVRAREAVVFVGAGPSVAANYPSWVTLIRTLCTKCAVEWIGDTSTATLLRLADLCLEANEQAYTSALLAEFDRKNGSTSTIYRRLQEGQFRAYVTLNFERLLEDEFRKNVRPSAWPALYAESMAVDPRDRPALFYLHGVISRVANWSADQIVLSEKQFTEAYQPNSILSSFLIQVLTSRSCVFVGTSLDEAMLQQLIDRCHHLLPKMVRKPGQGRSLLPMPQHFVLLPRERTNEWNDRYQKLRQSGMNIISFDPLDAQFTGLLDLLDVLIPTSHADTLAGLTDGGSPNG